MKIRIILYVFVSVFLIACSKNSQDIKNNLQKDTISRKSTHQLDYEKYSNHAEKISDTSNYILSIIEDKILVDKSLGNFTSPKFTNDGRYLVFTSHNFNQLWVYDFENKNIEKVVELPQCGFNFQISENDDIIFRIKVNDTNKPVNKFSIMKYSLIGKKLEVLFTSNRRITTPLLNKYVILFLQENAVKKLNAVNGNEINSSTIPFYYVENNYLIRQNGKIDTLFRKDNFKFVNSDFTQDKLFVKALTTNNGILLLDMNGNLVKQIKHANSLNKLSDNELIVYHTENYVGQRISSSEIFVGIISSNKMIKIENPKKELRFYPVWGKGNNSVAYITGEGEIKLIKLEIATGMK